MASPRFAALICSRRKKAHLRPGAGNAFDTGAILTITSYSRAHRTTRDSRNARCSGAETQGAASWAGFASAIPAERLRMAIGLGRRRVCAKGVAGNPARAARGIRRVRRYSTMRSEA